MSAFGVGPVAWAARCVCLGLAGALAGAAWAQDTQRVEITGSSIKRTDAETALPVQVITREEIARSGAVSTEARDPQTIFSPGCVILRIGS